MSSKKAKRNYFRTKIEENKGNPKEIWKSLKLLSGTDKSLNRILELNYKDTKIQDLEQISNALSEFIVNVGSATYLIIISNSMAMRLISD